MGVAMGWWRPNSRANCWSQRAKCFWRRMWFAKRTRRKDLRIPASKMSFALSSTNLIELLILTSLAANEVTAAVGTKAPIMRTHRAAVTPAPASPSQARLAYRRLAPVSQRARSSEAAGLVSLLDGGQSDAEPVSDSSDSDESGVDLLEIENGENLFYVQGALSGGDSSDFEHGDPRPLGPLISLAPATPPPDAEVGETMFVPHLG
ncbi:hypothetical protein J8273_0986 [Carpediemonas membranifera]|uniref:Uncharacterized protein n=1 Tax=Carpediemonas membranifera TaxID=201153 RepID=A0A8J6AYB7_9EUKA|nr:hypothetical protein J8273_0986 [Carpediemonas membranifera]|eukprot:KAG9397078.1 hypothetical protein J8273_0986 [Carpediemonas membranifera]